MSDLLSTPQPAARVRAFGFANIARHFRIQPAAARKWALTGVPAERVHHLARLMECRPHDLRPDLFGPFDTGPLTHPAGIVGHTSRLFETSSAPAG